MKQFILEGNTPSSKNSKIKTRWGGVIKNKNTLTWEKETEKTFVELKDDFLEAIKEKQKPYHIYFSFVRKSKHEADFINLCQAVFDNMVKHKWLEDDNMSEVLPFPLIDPETNNCFYWDKENPKTIITIL